MGVPSDIERVLKVPRRQGKCPDFTPYLKTSHGTMNLRSIQNEMLWQASQAGGLLGLVGVGEGKTLASFLFGRVLKAEKPLLLIPANLRTQAQADWVEYGKHFSLPQQLELRSYEEISTKPGLLRSLNPDLIICDEAHKLKNPASTRTRRLKKFLSWRVNSGLPPSKFIAISGSITSTSIKDFWHLALWALGPNTPLPMKWNYMNEWALSLDKGQLGKKKRNLGLMMPLMQHFGTRSPRDAFRENLLSCRGVVISIQGQPPCTLHIKRYSRALPKTIEGALKRVNETWQTPDGEELDSALALSRLRRQLVCGFYYYWDWPGNPDTLWLEARSNWAKACRTFCARAPEGLDTPALLENAMIRFLKKDLDIKFPKQLVEIYIQWLGQKSKPLPPVGVRWIDQYFLKDIISWANRQKDPPLIWYEHTALGYALHKVTGWPLYGTGEDADSRLVAVDKAHLGIASIRAHSQGKNLQAWGNHLVAHPLSDAGRWEQLLGRSHRTGQKRSDVQVIVPNYSEFSSALSSAVEGARYIQQSTGLEQRLLSAKSV